MNEPGRRIYHEEMTFDVLLFALIIGGGSFISVLLLVYTILVYNPPNRSAYGLLLVGAMIIMALGILFIHSIKKSKAQMPYMSIWQNM